MLDKKALEAALKEHSLASHHELPPIRWLERAIEAYLAALPDEVGSIVAMLRAISTMTVLQDDRYIAKELRRYQNDLREAADALEVARAKFNPTASSRKP